MTVYQLITRVRHFIVARHWHGAAIHSPMMYAFVRQHALTHRGDRLIADIGAPIADSMSEICNMESEIRILRHPFRNRQERAAFKKFYDENHMVTAHFQGVLVFFFDTKLQKQQYIIRN